MSEMKFEPNEQTGELTVSRVFSAPIQKVWDAWTMPDLFTKWWGPRGWNTTVKHMDVTPGGYLLYGMKCEDEAQGDWFGKVSWGKSVYESVNPTTELVYTDYFTDDEGVVDPNMPKMKISVRFEETSEGTLVTSTTIFNTPEDLKTVIDMGMKEGLIQTWDRLEEMFV